MDGGARTHRINFLKKNKLEERAYSLEELAKISSVPLDTLKKVYARGIGAYKTNPTSVRLKGSYVKGVNAPMTKKLSKEQWAAARVYSFLDGNPKHDNDLRGGANGMELEAGAEKSAEEYALSDTDIKQLLGGDIKITSYPDLDKVHDVNELFDRRGRAIIFFPQQNEQSGHWCCMIKDGKHIEFFDPYGEEPDAQKDTLSKGKLEQMNMAEPLLADLLINSPCKVIFNKVQLQKLSDDVQTCGRHCVTRLLYSKYPIQRYREIIRKSGLTPDQFVVEKTYSGLGK